MKKSIKSVLTIIAFSLFLSLIPSGRLKAEGIPEVGSPEYELLFSEVYVIPEDFEFNVSVENTTYMGLQTIFFNSDTESDTTIFYIHGGSFIAQPLEEHLGFADRLALSSKAEVIMPIYPLAPKHQYQETFDDLLILYTAYITENPDRKVILAGDSAGANIALCLSQRIRDLGIDMPYKLVLISPWADLTLTNPFISLYPDAAVGVPIMQVAASWWCGETDPSDPSVSPLFADLTGLPQTYIIEGTSDYLYPDVVILADNMKAAGCKVKLLLSGGLTHSFPVMYYQYCGEEILSIARFCK